MTKINCSICKKKIENNQCYFYGRIIPESDESGIRKFGCCPDQKICMVCFEILQSKQKNIGKYINKELKPHKDFCVCEKCY